MLPPRRATLFVLLLLTVSMAGCNVRDWYNQEGTVHIELKVNGDPATYIDELRSVRIAVYGVSVHQTDALNPDHFSFGTEPLVLDLVEAAKAGEQVRLATFKSNLRATDRVAIRMVVFEAIHANGESLQICRLSDTVEKWPCFYQPDDAALAYEEKAFAPPRGGEVVVGFPLAVQYATRGQAAQYYLQANPADVSLVNHR